MNTHSMRRVFALSAIGLFALTVAMSGTAEAKSLYVNRDLNANSPIRAYDIQASPTYLAYQNDSVPTRYGGVGLAIDTDSETLFVTFEFSGMLDVVDANTLAKLAQVTAPEATNLAGIVVDQEKQRVYTVNRGSQSVYVYDYVYDPDADTRTLTLVGTVPVPLAGVEQAYGLALDEVNDILYVADYSYTVKAFNTSDWSSAGTVPVSVRAVGIAVDPRRGFLYTGSILNYDLSQYDLIAGTEVTTTIGNEAPISPYEKVCGIAVDLDTGLVYCTTLYNNDTIMVYDSGLNFLHSVGDIGNPTGIVVPSKEISYNPLNLTKEDMVGGEYVHEDESGIDSQVIEVYSGDLLTYEISYDSSTNTEDVNNVTIVDTLPADVSFVSCTGGSYDAVDGTITWAIGEVLAGSAGEVFYVEVTVDPEAAGTTITNTCVINSDETPQTTVNRPTDIEANRLPVADAGGAQTVECNLCPLGLGTCVMVDGSASYDPDGDDITFVWEVNGVVQAGETGSALTYPFPLGTTDVQLTVTDEYGASDCDSVAITIQDTTLPTINVNVDTAVLWPPNHKMRTVTVTVTAFDACMTEADLEAAVICVVSSSEPDEDPTGDGKTTGDVNGQDGYSAPVYITPSSLDFSFNEDTGLYEAQFQIELRAEREGDRDHGNGRIYTIEGSLLDSLDNLGEGSCTVLVPHDKNDLK